MKIYTALFVLVLLLIGACHSSIKQKTPPLNKEAPPNVRLYADFTQSDNIIGEIFDFFDVSVRTERGNPKGVPAHFGRIKRVNTVRMLGGWRNQDLNGDTYLWNGKNYEYNFEAATKRIDGWLENDWQIFQIVLDNPPWAFQRGYHFVSEPDGKHYLEKDRIGVYGNGLPPNDPLAWNRYVQAFISFLVKTYGKETVLSWRFRVGSEIDTRPQHWSGTRQQFFDHYKNTVDAVKAVLPRAKVGAHFREGSFKSRYIDYTGNKENAYAVPFIIWAKENNIPYDFLAISYYPHITKENELNLEHVYNHDIAPIQQHPDFNQDASLEIHEFKFISKMLKAGFVSVSTSHASSFFAMFSKMMLEKNIKNVFQWGNQRGGNYSPDAMTQLAIHSMLGKQHFKSTVQGESEIKGNDVAGIFSQNTGHSQFDILLYNFNKINFTYQAPEKVRVAMAVEHPVGTLFKYRIGKINRFNNVEDQFYAQFPKAKIAQSEGGWRKKNIHHTAAVEKLLNTEGMKVFKQQRTLYGKTNTLNWSDWQQSTVVKNEKGEAVIWVDTKVESFGVQKLEIRIEP